ncbi:MAG: hypothetical protein AAGJ18_26495, partial [Bacteroidota bacterium]
DNCTDAPNLKFRLELETTFDGTLPEATEITFEEAGTYAVVLWVVDEAGNTNNCFAAVTVAGDVSVDCNNDTAPPSLSCVNGLQTIEVGLIFAQDFILSTTDDCTPEQDLNYGIQLAEDFSGLMPNEFFIDFTNPGIYSVYVWVADAAGNSTYCKNQIIISETVTVQGIVFADEDGDCQQGANETGLSQSVRLTLLENGQSSYTVVVASQGGAFGARIPRPTATDAKLSVSLVSDDLSNCLSGENYDVAGLAADATITVNPIGVQLTEGCADLGVTIEALNGSCESESVYIINFYNGGTVTANAFIEVDFTNVVQFIRLFSSHSYQYTSAAEGRKYTFQIDELAPGADGSILIFGQQVCDFANQTQVTTATITADNACSNNFMGARIEITQDCIGDEVQFKLQNKGLGDMLESTQFIVVEDVIMRSEGTIQLGAGESETLTFPATGATYYVRADQVADYPWQASVAKVSEGCAANLTDISTGIVAQLPLENTTPYIDVDVLENKVKTLNSLEALPRGIGEDHLVAPNTPIEYAIDYANTKEELVKNMEIEVKVSEHLDLNTLNVTFATHPAYDLSVDGRTLTFSFPNIDLVSNEISEEEGSGLLKFTLAQKPDVAIDTKIESAITINFDGEKVAGSRSTDDNTFFHTVGTLAFSTAVETILQEDVGLTVYPNPFHDYTTFKVDNPQGLTLDFELYNTNGQLMRHQQ